MAADVDELFSLPLAEFTAARNELAKRLAKEGDAGTAAEVRKLAKPTLPAWAVNQLVRREPELVEQLIESGEALQQQVLKGTSGPSALRAAQQGERKAVRDLVHRAQELLEEAGHSTGTQTVERISVTLTAGAQSASGREALRAGRLSTELEPPGFEALAGMAAPALPRDELADTRAKQQREQERRRLESGVRELERKADAAEREADCAEREAAKARKAAERARKAAERAAEEFAGLD